MYHIDAEGRATTSSRAMAAAVGFPKKGLPLKAASGPDNNHGITAVIILLLLLACRSGGGIGHGCAYTALEYDKHGAAFFTSLNKGGAL